MSRQDATKRIFCLRLLLAADVSRKRDGQIGYCSAAQQLMRPEAANLPCTPLSNYFMSVKERQRPQSTVARRQQLMRLTGGANKMGPIERTARVHSTEYSYSTATSFSTVNNCHKNVSNSNRMRAC